MAESRNTDEAMNAVLRAERDAREAVAKCREQADRILAEGRERARRIGTRTESRITRLHTHCAADAHRRVEAMLKAERQPSNTLLPASEDEVLQAAVDLLADELIGKGEGR